MEGVNLKIDERDQSKTLLAGFDEESVNSILLK